MTENQAVSPQPAAPAEDEINLLDLLIVLVRHKKMILGVTIVAAMLVAGISMLLPSIYTGTSKILPPQSSQSSSVNSVMLAQLGGLAGAAGGALGLKDPNALYIAMLKSRNIAERIVQRFDLKKAYGKEFMTDTLKTLENRSVITAGKDGVITVGVDDEDPQRAAALANAYIEELNKLMQTFALTEASQRRQFFETQLKPAKDKLTDAEAALDRTPNTSLQYMEALRNLKYRETMFEILSKQFEVAKLDEAKDAPLIQVLDKATAPERRSSPKRKQMVMFAALVAFFLAVVWIFIREAMRRIKNQPEQAARIQELRRVFGWKKHS